MLAGNERVSLMYLDPGILNASASAAMAINAAIEAAIACPAAFEEKIQTGATSATAAASRGVGA